MIAPLKTASARLSLTRCIEETLKHPQAASLALLAIRDDPAMQEAIAYDTLLAQHPSGLPLTGTILAVKACFDVAGWVSHAGSRVLANATAASSDAPVVTRLRRAGAVLRAQTNMTEFAYGALGLNPWYGTPTTPLITQKPCVAGGSSSGGAVATALGMADLALCSDTSGSSRIPAAFCGVAGFKPSRGRYPDAGLIYLSPSFDVPGLIAGSAAICRKVDHALIPCEQTSQTGSAAVSLHGLRLAIPDAWLSGQLDHDVGAAFQQWLAQLTDHGAYIETRSLPMLANAGRVASDGGIIAAEAYHLHQQRLAGHADEYDPRVGPRIALGADVKAHRYVAAQLQLQTLGQEYAHAMDGADAVVTPTVPMLPPDLAQLQDNEIYARDNHRSFQLTEFANRLDLPSISLPGNLNQRQPIGLLLTGKRGRDSTLLDIAERIEFALSSD